MKLAQYLRAKNLWPRRASLPDPFEQAAQDFAKEAGQPPLSISQRGIDFIHSFEGCAKSIGNGLYKAYPDPGSDNGLPWTIGWGSTGPDIKADTIWTQEQCDQRFDRDIVKYVEQVRAALKDAPTTQNQFDALVSFHYNTGAIARATLTEKHRAKDYGAAALEFTRWVFNDGQRMPGLERRRKAEAALYRGNA